MESNDRVRRGFRLGAVLFPALLIAGCARQPTADDLRAVVLAQMAKAEGQAGVSDVEAFGSLTALGSSTKGSNVAYSVEIPRGRRLYAGEVLYQRGWLKYTPLQVDVRLKSATVTLQAPPGVTTEWQTVHAKYRIFVHAKQPLSTFGDFATRPILVGLVNDDLEPIAWPITGFEGPIDPAVKGLKVSILPGNTIGMSGPVPTILADLASFLAAGGIPAGQIEVQNGVDAYEKAFSADERRIAVITRALASKLRYGQFSDLAEVVVR